MMFVKGHGRPLAVCYHNFGYGLIHDESKHVLAMIAYAVDMEVQISMSQVSNSTFGRIGKKFIRSKGRKCLAQREAFSLNVRVCLDGKISKSS